MGFYVSRTLKATTANLFMDATLLCQLRILHNEHKFKFKLGKLMEPRSHQQKMANNSRPDASSSGSASQIYLN